MPPAGDREKGRGSVPPEILEAVRREFGIAHRVLDVLVAEPCLQRPRIVPGIGQGVATGVPQHVREDREGHAGALAEALSSEVLDEVVVAKAAIGSVISLSPPGL